MYACLPEDLLVACTFVETESIKELSVPQPLYPVVEDAFPFAPETHQLLSERRDFATQPRVSRMQ